MAKTKKTDEAKELNRAGYSAKLVCIFLLFVVIYGRMILSTLGEDSGFSRKKSASIANVTITGEVDGQFFDKEILPDLKEVMQRIF